MHCSVSKDRVVKYWDLDRFEVLLELLGHHAEVWALAVSQYGDFVMTGRAADLWTAKRSTSLVGGG